LSVIKTIDYYNKHAEEFTASTFEVDMESLYQPFLAELSEGKVVEWAYSQAKNNNYLCWNG
jgi:hypothetical protein